MALVAALRLLLIDLTAQMLNGSDKALVAQDKERPPRREANRYAGALENTTAAVSRTSLLPLLTFTLTQASGPL
jgi:hypothetical protein